MPRSPGQLCLQIWVSNDFTLARGWFMGFAKRLGQIYLTEYHPLNPRMPLLGPGAIDTLQKKLREIGHRTAQRQGGLLAAGAERPSNGDAEAW